MLLLKQGGTTDRPPPLTSHTWPPQTAHAVPPRGWQLTSGSRCILCPAGWSGGGTGGRLQISRLLTVLVILSTPRRRRGVCLAAWLGTGGLPWSRWPSYINWLPPRCQRGRDGERGMARLRPEPCLALTQLQQASARRGGDSGDTPRSGQGAVSSPRPPRGGLPQSGKLGRLAAAAGPGQTLQLTAPGQAAHGLGLPAKRGVTGTEPADPGSLHSPMHFSLCSPSQPITPSSLGGAAGEAGAGLGSLH